MKQTTPRSEWEDIPGFDRTTRKYIRLDGDAWLDAQRIRAEGEERGKRNQPGPDETLPDAMYRRIETWIQKRALDCKDEVGKYINEELANLHEFGSFWEKEKPSGRAPPRKANAIRRDAICSYCASRARTHRAGMTSLTLSRARRVRNRTTRSMWRYSRTVSN